MARFSFVEDTDLIVSDWEDKGTNLASQMQLSLQMWHGLLCVTGGDLVPDKCFWYFIDFQWHQQQWRYKSIHDLPGRLTVTGEGGVTILIPQLETLEACWTLGVHLVLDGNDKEEVKYLLGVITAWHCNMFQEHLTQEEVNYSLQHIGNGKTY